MFSSDSKLRGSKPHKNNDKIEDAEFYRNGSKQASVLSFVSLFTGNLVKHAKNPCFFDFFIVFLVKILAKLARYAIVYSEFVLLT
jgi:hypothetical protein